MWRGLLTPTIAYKPAILFALTLVFGWRGFVCCQIISVAAFASFLGWQGAALMTPLYLVSQVCAYWVARAFKDKGPWLSGERSTLGFLAAAAIAPLVPALLSRPALQVIGLAPGGEVPEFVDSWLRGVAGILVVTPVVLVCCSRKLAEWGGVGREDEGSPALSGREVLELAIETAAWTAALLMTVEFERRYGLNITYLTFLPPLAFTVMRGMRVTTLAIAAKGILATTLWSLLHWANALPINDLRLLIAIYATTILVMASVVDERKRANSKVEELRSEGAALRKSEDYFRTLANSAPVMVWLSGTDKLCTFVNEPWLKFTGRTIAEELGAGWAAFVHPDDSDRCLNTYASAFDARLSFQMEYRVKCVDGEYRWVLDHGIPRFRDGEFIGFIGACVDVTRQKLIEERLRTNEVRLLNTQRLAKVGNWELDVGSNNLYWSAEVFRLYGLEGEAPRDFAALLSAVHPRDRAIMQEARDRALSHAAPVSVEFRVIRPDGEVRFARTVGEAIKDDRGSVARLVGATQDISDQVHAREHLRESERRLRNAERLAHIGHWQFDIKTNTVSGSEEMYRIFGKPDDYVPSYGGFLEDLYPADRERMERLVKESLDSKIGQSMEYQVAHPDGALKTISCIWEVLLDDEGSPEQIFGTCQDITESRRAQEEAFRRQKLESVGTLASGIAHDFNNLMGAVLAQAELASDEFASGSSPEEELERIRTVATQGAEIVRQLMVYAGEESETPALVDVSRIVAEMLDLLRVTVAKGVVLETDLGKGLPAVRANAAQLRQVVLNLITNASEAMGEREGVIRVATSSITIGGVAAIPAGAADGDYLQLQVSDTGCGMPPEVQARVLDPFFSTKFAGRGLGLAVVQGIVQKLGGAINITSEPDKGTTFQILLPCAENGTGAAADAVVRADEPVFSLQEANILVVEDEDALRRAVAKMLRRKGLHVIEAADGSAAIDMLRANGRKIGLILLDMNIPGSLSREVIAEASRLQPDAKVILTSAYSEQMVMATMNSPLIRGFIRKPFQLGDLLQTFRNVLSS